MSIVFEEAHKIFSIHTKQSTYQIKVGKYGHLLHLYYGNRINDNMDHILTFVDRGFSGNPYEAGYDKTYSLDILPQEYPTEGTGDYRITSMIVKNSDGSYSCDLRYKKYRIAKGKYNIPVLPNIYANEDEAETLEIIMEDTVNNLQVTLLYGVLEKYDVITRSVKIENKSNKIIQLKKVLSATLDFQFGDYDWISFYGRHNMERNVQRTKIAHGIQSIGSKRGMSSHQYNPFLIVADTTTTEEFGNSYGMCLVYSGSFKAEIELDQLNQTRISMGLQDDMFLYELKPENVFYGPEVVMSFSNSGLTKLSHNYHDVFREHLIRGKYKSIPKPILLNNWEATYFDFDGEKIISLAKEISTLGIEMLVLDDGWFGSRNDEFSGLGDWKVNEKKLGCSLTELVEKVNNLGLKFGIWVEPEMISEDSDLFRTHPDWAIMIPGRDPIRSRYQLVLDFSRKEVVDYIFEKICSILDSANIEYIKWDFNRCISDVYSNNATNQGALLYDYMLGLYDILERLVNHYPNLLIESCSGGGGRFDAGMLHYSPQIWTSDNTDAIDRIKIQEGTSFAYPITTFGSHVSDVPNHQTGRSTPFETRAAVSMVGSFGYELDISKIAKEDKDQIKEQIKFYKKHWELIHRGDYYRLTNSQNQNKFASWQFVNKTKSQTLITVITLETNGNSLVHYLKCRGLDKNAFYAELKTKKVYSGLALMNGGFRIPFTTDEYQTIHILLNKVS